MPSRSVMVVAAMLVIHQTGNGRYMMTPVIGIVSVQ